VSPAQALQSSTNQGGDALREAADQAAELEGRLASQRAAAAAEAMSLRTQLTAVRLQLDEEAEERGRLVRQLEAQQEAQVRAPPCARLRKPRCQFATRGV
jgi:hypothetical protein